MYTMIRTFSLPLRSWAGALLLAAMLSAPFADAAGQSREDPQMARFRLADAFLRAGQFEQAIGLLEDLYAGAPRNETFYQKLKEAYENVKRYDEATALIQSRLADTRSAALLSDLARIRYLQGDEEAARATWEEAVATAPADPMAWRVVYQSLVAVREFDQAVSLLEEAREATGMPALFRVDLAWLCSISGRYGQATKEYLALLKENEGHLDFVRARMTPFMEDQEALAPSIAAARNAVQTDPLYRAWRELLGWLYAEASDFPRALEEYRAIDGLENGQGSRLFEFALAAADAGAWEEAAKAWQEVLTRYPDAPAAPRTLAALGAMHTQQAEEIGERAFDETGQRVPAPHYDQALAAYQAFLQAHPNHAMYPDVLHRVGRLQQDVFLDIGAAESVFLQALAAFPDTRAADRAAFDLAHIAIERGQLDEARLRFNRLVDRLRTGELAEQSRFDLARIHLFAGEFDAALALVDILDAHTSTNISNDAIALKILLLENRGPDSLDTPLRRYAGALLAQKQRQPLAALDSLDALLAAYPGHALADEARFLRGEILLAAGRREEAYATFAEIPLMHPASFLTDRALFEAAGILSRNPDTREEAAAAYRRLLSEYPGSLLADKARDRLRRLRGDEGV